MKLENLITPFKVGLLVVLGTAAAIFMVTILGGGPTPGGYVKVYGMFDDVTGLAEQSQVMMAGIPIGEVEKISLVDGKARVDLTIRRDLEARAGIEQPDGLWKNGATLTKKQASFIGDFFIEVTPGTEGPVLEDGDEVHNVIVPLGIDQMLERFDAIAEDIQTVTESLSTVFGGPEGQRKIQALLDNLTEITITLNKFVGDNSDKVDRILSNAERVSADIRDLTADGGESVQTILRDTESIVAEIRVIVGQSSSDLQSGLGTLKGTLSRLQSTLDSLNYSLQNIQDITDKVNEGEGTLGELVNNPAIAQRTEQVLTDAGLLLGGFTRLRTIIDLRSEYHTNVEQLKNVVGLRIQPSDDKYYLVELIDDYRGVVTPTRRVVSGNDPLDPSVRAEDEIEITDDFKFSVQFAKTFEINDWFSLTGRFGIIENSGGVGGNVLLLEDQSLALQADIFDFDVDVNPRVRTFMTYQFFGVMYILGGVDDIFNDGRRQPMVGIGVRFDDEDLRFILGATGIPGN
jgi:phospholipid/cholesterol/gamma-HCH transport system substrate-binding protein